MLINAKYLLKPDWFIGVGFKKEFSGLFKSPYAFSAGIDGEIFENKLFLAANISQIYSLPTLNDLYWNPGGNENLLPEKGINSQLNIKWNFFKSSLISITGFYSYIDDWIQWLPNSSGNFSPVNIKQVESNGIEASLKQEILWRNWKLNFSGNYGFTNTINTSFEGNGELVYKQLIYVPKQIFNTTALLYYKNTGVYSIWEFTGERFTTADNTRSLDPYAILNLGVIINYKYDLFLFTIKPEIKNLLNTSYQPIPWRAMPGRSYFLTINLNLNFKKN
jgi:iron complex outermembrane receptor protein